MTSSEPDRDAGLAQQANQSETAEARVGAGLRRLDTLESVPLSEHGPVYEALHDHLQGVLAEIDSA